MTDASGSNAPTTEMRLFGSFINELREIMALSMEQPLDTAHMESLLECSGELLTQLRQHRQKRALPLYVVNFSDGGISDQQCDDMQPYSPISGAFNPVAPPLKHRRDGDRLQGEVTLGGVYEGPPQAVHGAVVAAIYDQLLATANAISGTAGPTAWLKVNYTKPTPLNTPLRFVAWKAEQDGRKILMRGQCFAGDEVITDCEALFIQYIPKGVAEAIRR